MLHTTWRRRATNRAVIPSASLPPYTGASVRLGTRALLFSLRENRCPWLRRVWSVSASRPTPPPGRCHFARAGASSLGAHAARAFLSPCPKASHPTSPSRVHSSITTSAPTHVWEEEPHRRVVEGASAAKSVCLAPSNRRGNALAVGHILMLLPRARGPRRCSARVRGGAGWRGLIRALQSANHLPSSAIPYMPRVSFATLPLIGQRWVRGSCSFIDPLYRASELIPVKPRAAQRGPAPTPSTAPAPPYFATPGSTCHSRCTAPPSTLPVSTDAVLVRSAFDVGLRGAFDVCGDTGSRCGPMLAGRRVSSSEHRAAAAAVVVACRSIELGFLETKSKEFTGLLLVVEAQRRMRSHQSAPRARLPGPCE